MSRPKMELRLDADLGVTSVAALGGPELAAVFDISPVTARTRLFRARAALEKAIVALSKPGADFDIEGVAASLPKR